MNCGVKTLQTNLTKEQLLKKRKEIINELFNNIPSGVGRGGKTKISKDALAEVIEKGAKWTVEQGYGNKEDLKRTEENGCMKDADFSEISERAIARGLPQLGSLGAGNHFLEIQTVNKIFDEKIAKIFGIEKQDQVTVTIHCGSRGLGHQIASDYIKKMEQTYGTKDLPDRELVNAPIQSDLGQAYYKAMCGAVNYAFTNRQMIAHWVRESFKKIFGNVELKVVYDVTHNTAKLSEKYKINNKIKKIGIMRKGATRSLGPGREEIPEVYRKVGQPVIIPSSMGTASYILVGTKKAEEISFGSAPHGAGRVMSRHSALKQFRGEKVKNQLLKEKNIEVKSGSWKSIAEEAPGVYKKISDVIEVSHKIGIGNLIAEVFPLATIKG